MSPERALNVQLATGLLDAWVWGAVVWALGTSQCGAIDPLCGAVGWLGCGLWPFGFLQVFLALRARASPDPTRGSRGLARLQLFGIVLGSLPTAVIGTTVLLTLDDGPPR